MRKASIISPLVAFPAIWVLGVAFAQVHLLDFQSSWSALTWVVMAAVPIAFVIGGVVAAELVRRAVPARQRERRSLKSSRALRIALVACLALGYLELAHQWIAGQGIPLLSSSVDEVRFAAPRGPPVLLTDLLTVAAIVALTVPRRLLARESRFELGVAGAALVGFALNGGRVTIILPLVSALIARTLYWGPPPRRQVIAATALMVSFVAAVFYLRSAQHSGNLFENELYSSVLPETPFPFHALVPVHIGLTTNFETLAQVIDHFPRQEAYANGAFNAQGADLFIGSARSLGEVTAVLTPPWTTATVAGTLWADGGFPLVVLGVAATGAISTASYAYARLRPGSLAAAMVAGVLIYHAVFNFYTNLWTQHLDWLLICPLLVIMAAIARDPGLPGRVVDHVRSRAGRRYPVRVPGKADTRRPSVRRTQPPKGLRSAPWPAIALGVGALLLAGLIVDRTAPDTAGPTGAFETAEERALPQGSQADLGNALATDGDLTVDNVPLWTVEQSGGVAMVRAISFASPDELRSSSEAEVELDSGFTSPSFDIAVLEGGPALYAIQPTSDGADVQVAALEPRAGPTALGLEDPHPVSAPETVLRTSVSLPPPDPRAQREFAVATWSGSQPDLLVIDRGVPIDRGTVSIRSGESDFQREVDSFELPLAGLSPDQWDVDVGILTEGEPDLILFNRSDTGSGRPEVHVLGGETEFSQFLLQSPTDLPKQLPPGYRLLLGSSLGAPTVYGVDGQGEEPSVDLIPLAARGSAP